MKRSLKFFLLATVCLTFFACKKDNAPSSRERTAFKMSDLVYLAQSLLRLDGNGTILGYLLGTSLNEADPYEISVPVENFDEAVEIFKGLVPEEGKITIDGKTVSWNLTDETGETEGEAILSEGSKDGVIAVMTSIRPQLLAEAGGMIKRSLIINFIASSAWPENASPSEEIKERLGIDYAFGSVIPVAVDCGFGTGQFVVIREWTSRAAGLMIRVVPTVYKYGELVSGAGNELSRLSAKPTLLQMHKILHRGTNYHDIVEVIGPTVGWPASLDYPFLTSSFCGGPDRIAINLQSGLSNILSDARQDCCLVYAYCFGPGEDGQSIKFW